MTDVHSKLYKELFPRLPKQEDRDLLKRLLEIQQESGKEGLQARLKAMIEGIEVAAD